MLDAADVKESTAAASEAPKRRRKRGKAAEASAETVEAVAEDVGDDTDTAEDHDNGEELIQEGLELVGGDRLGTQCRS